MTESVENHSECCGCVNGLNKFVSNRSVNHENPHDTVMKSYLRPSFFPFKRKRGNNAP